MPDSTLVGLTSASAFTGSELFYTVQGGNDRKATSSQFYQYITTVSTLGGATPSALTLVSDTNVTLSPTGLSSAALLNPITITAGWTGVLPSSRIGTIGSSQIVGGVGGTPGGVSGNIQFNSSGVFSGILNSSWDPVNSLFSMQANTLTVLSTIATEKFRIDNTGLITNGGPNISIGPTGNCIIEVFGDGSALSGQAQIALNNNNQGLGFVCAKTRGTSPSSNVIVQVGDNLGSLITLGNDGTGYVRGSGINFDVDAVPGAGSMPSNIRLMTVSSGSVVRTERMRLDSVGNVTIGSGSSNVQIQATDVRLEVVTDANPWQLGVITTGNTAGVGGWVYAKTRGTVGSSQVLVQLNDRMLLLEAAGSDGVNYQNAARIQAWVDGIAGAGSMPGRWTFETTPFGSIASIERVRIDQGGSVGIGTTSGLANVDGGSRFQVVEAGVLWHTSFFKFGNDAAGPSNLFYKTRNAAYNGNTIVQSSDSIGNIWFYGNDGAAGHPGAAVNVAVDGAPGLGSMPGRWEFSTTPSGAIVPTERMRIDNAGVVVVGGSSARLLDALSGSPQHFQMHGFDIPTASAGFARWSVGSGGPKWFFAKSRGAAVGTHAAVAANDQLALVYGNGDDGTQFIQAGLYSVEVDGAVAANTVPGRLGFYTASGAGVIERLRIDNAGNAWLMTATSTTGATPAGARGNINETVALYNHQGMGGI